jgi:hypothetical protein
MPVSNYKKNSKNKKFIAYNKPSDNYWKNNFMRVLLAMYYNEATWSIDKWHEFGISQSDAKKIEAEFFRYKHYFEKKQRNDRNKNVAVEQESLISN